MKEKGYTYQAFRTANAIAFRACKWHYLFYIALSCFMIAGTYLSLWSTEYTVTGAYEVVTGKSSPKALIFGLTVFTFVQILFYLIGLGKDRLNRYLKLEITHFVRKSLNEKLSSIRWEYYETNEVHLKIHEVNGNAAEKIFSFVTATVTYLTLVPKILLYCYYLFQINVWFILIYVTLMIGCNVFGSKLFRKTSGLWKEIQPYSQKRSYYFGLCGSKNAHQEYQANRMYAYTAEHWEEAYQKEYRLRLKIFRNYEILLQASRILNNIPYIAMLLFIAYEIAQGHLAVGFLAMANQLLNGVLDTFVSVTNSLSSHRIESQFVRSYDEVMELEEETEEKDGFQAEFQSILFSNVTYQYPQSEQQALKGLSLSVKRGEKIAVVGVNGSGKTTCMNLLFSLTQRFGGSLTDEKGRNLVLKQNVSCILQDFMQYQMSIKENIAMGCVQRELTDEEACRILKQVGLYETVLGLEQGIHTKLGQLEHGIELSKGQWQKLAIARLLANSQADVWILDEPTAYLDPIAEIEIYEMIYQLAEDRTVFFISHRLGFAQRADRILVLANGCLQESGTHLALIEENGSYAQMYQSQKEWYAS